jgi:hypothetical protein
MRTSAVGYVTFTTLTAYEVKIEEKEPELEWMSLTK